MKEFITIPQNQNNSISTYKLHEANRLQKERTASAGKIMVLFVWDAKGVLLINSSLEGEKSIIEKYSVSLLEKLKTVIVEKRPGLAKKKMLFHYNNAHLSCDFQQKLINL